MPFAESHHHPGHGEELPEEHEAGLPLRQAAAGGLHSGRQGRLQVVLQVSPVRKAKRGELEGSALSAGDIALASGKFQRPPQN